MKTPAIILALALFAPADAASLRGRRRLADNLDLPKLLDEGKKGHIGSKISFKLDKDHKVVARGHPADLAAKKAFGLDMWYETKCAHETSDKKKVAGATLKKLKHFLDSEDHDGVAYIEPELEHKLMREMDDPMIGDQTHYDGINLKGAWDTTTGNPNVVVQVIDSGVDMSHPDLQNNIWKNPGEICGNGVDDDNNGYVDDCHGYNFADDEGTNLVSSDSHGSHCGGTIAADSNNGVGVAGVAGGDGSPNSGAKLMIAVVFSDASIYGFAEALVYGANNGAQISSNSWGYLSPGAYDQAELDAIDYYNSKDGLVVFAAGNGGTDEDWYPAYHDGAIAVAATDDHGDPAGFTCYGDWIDISAPGVWVLSTGLGDQYEFMSGTSMACPHVSGVLALGKSVNMAASRDELLKCMADTAKDIGSGDYAGKLGAGLVDAEAFVECAANGAPSARPTISPAPTTAAPSLKPTISPAPTPDCGCNQQLVVNFVADAFPQENSVELKALELPRGCVDEGVVKVDFAELEAGGKKDVVLSEQICAGVTYEFKFLDSFGDGLCCGEGNGGFDGSYKLVLEGEKIHEGAEFGKEDIFKFTPGGEGGDGGGDDPIGDDPIGDDPIGDDPTMPPVADDPNMPPEEDDPADDESANCECVGNSDSMGSEVCTAFVTEYSCDLAPYDCSWKCDDGSNGDDGGEEGDDFAMPSSAPTAAASDAPTTKASDAPTAKPSHAPTAKPEEDDETPTMKVSTVYNAKSHKKVGKIAIFSWEAEPVDFTEDYEPETYAGIFRIEVRYDNNLAEYETLTEQIVTEGTDGKYYFVMPEAACKKKVQVRVTGLGPDGQETAAKQSKFKKLKC
ncbi:serine-type endopeptidase [Aureococcus anophagefferens]|nr:serine-type endopeptidase [Aureococcus anophagefferens]